MEYPSVHTLYSSGESRRKLDTGGQLPPQRFKFYKGGIISLDKLGLPLLYILFWVSTLDFITLSSRQPNGDVK